MKKEAVDEALKLGIESQMPARTEPHIRATWASMRCSYLVIDDRYTADLYRRRLHYATRYSTKPMLVALNDTAQNGED